MDASSGKDQRIAAEKARIAWLQQRLQQELTEHEQQFAISALNDSQASLGRLIRAKTSHSAAKLRQMIEARYVQLHYFKWLSEQPGDPVHRQFAFESISEVDELIQKLILELQSQDPNAEITVPIRDDDAMQEMFASSQQESEEYRQQLLKMLQR
jgi:hypothetical protein